MTVSDDDAIPPDTELRFLEILDGPRAQWSAAVEALCERVPEHATQLRAWLREALEHGTTEPGTPPKAAAPSVDPVEIGPYRVLQRLGSGGMGTVYLAEQREPVRRRVAIKVIKLGMDSRAVVARFEVEQQALARMDHPAIAKVFAAGLTDRGQPYFVMEYVRGLPITQYCDENRLSLEDRLELFRQVCAAVQHAHNKGVIHRDLTPSNVLVAMQDRQAVAKIIDFGLARAIDHTLTAQTAFTEQGMVLGTPAYMSPEQAGLDALDIDTRTDIYTLGVLLYELLTGCLPFEREELKRAGYDGMCRLIRESDPPCPSAKVTTVHQSDHAAKLRRTDARTLLGKLRGDLDWIVMRCLEKDRTRRYETPSELAADVLRHVRGEPVHAAPPSAWYRVRRFVKRHRLGVAAAVVAGSAILTGTLIATTASARESEAHLWRDWYAGALRVLDLEKQADQLWPADAARAPALRQWLEEVESLGALVARLDPHLAAISRGAVGGQSSLATLRDQTRQLFAEDGAVPRLRRRLEFATKLRTSTIETPATTWRAATAAVDADPRFATAKLVPLEGLLPLGPDPHSGLQEFAVLVPGLEPPTRGGDGGLLIAPGASPVLVLVPGGSFSMGAPGSLLDRLGGAVPVRVDTPAHAVALRPFFISKYEITQGQWLAVMGKNPAGYGPLRQPDPRKYPDRTLPELTLAHPVETITWTEASEFARRLGLALPTEAQWECAARAGSTQPWWFGAGEPDLPRHAQFAYGYQRLSDQPDPGLVHMPVHALTANPWGLHHVHGNVEEWCADYWSLYTDDIREREGDGLRVPALTPKRPTHVVRGGSFGTEEIEKLRVTGRTHQEEGLKTESIGLRPVRALD